AWRAKKSLAPAKESHRPPDQQADHYQIDEEGAEPGEVVLPSHVAYAEDERRGEGAGNRSQSADGDDDEDIHKIGQRERRIQSDDLDRQRAAQAGEPAAERKGDHEGAVEVDAQPARHALVIHGGAALTAEAGVLQ